MKSTMIVTLFLLGITGLYIGGYLDDMIGSPVAPTSNGNGNGNYYGAVNPTIVNSNKLDSSSTFAEGSAVHTKFFRNPNCNAICETGYILANTGNSSFNLQQEDNSVFFAVVDGSVDTVILDIRSTLQANSIIESYSFIDFDNNAKKDHVFRINVRGQSLSAGQTDLTLPITNLWYQIPATLSGSVQEPSKTLVDLPSGDATTTGLYHVGQSANNSQVFRYRFQFANVDEAILVREIQLAYNSSATAQWESIQITVPMYNPDTNTISNVILTDTNFDEEVLSTNSTMKWKFASDLSGQRVIPSQIATLSGSTSFVDITIAVTFKLNDDARLHQNLMIKYWDQDEIEKTAQAGVMIYDGNEINNAL